MQWLICLLFDDNANYWLRQNPSACQPKKITYSENGSYRKEAAAFAIDTNKPKFASLEKKIHSSDSFSFIGEVLVKTREVENEG